ncbi:zinc finger protein 609-like isoform X2 [Trematomus bernacchii]|nr:zinc finger protein 609-like isoform X2 [Trematomus bernacchii]
MSLSSGPAGGKGLDSNAVDTYDSGDEWDIGVGNLIIDLDADLEKDKLEMSSSKEGGGMAAPPQSAVATLPENIKFVSPVAAAAAQGKESKSKSKRSKNSKDSVKAPGPDAKKEVLVPPQNSTPTKGTDKSNKPSRTPPAVKKDKDGVSGKSKKEKMEAVVVSVNAEKEVPVPRSGLSFEGQLIPDLSAVEQQIGNVSLDSAGIGQPVAMTTEQQQQQQQQQQQEEEVDNGECRSLKKVGGVKMESPISTPAPPPLHPLVSGSGGDISSPCEQLMVRTRSVAVNTADAALATEPECLGPCEPGTSVNLEGIVWQETEDGMLVVNVTWRNKTYVGTLLDCTRHDWAPPRFCESPSSDVEMRGGRGRGKRIRPGSNTPLNDNSNSSDNKGSGSSKTRGGGSAAAANSKGRRGSQTAMLGGTEASPSSNKRKNKPASDMEPTSSSEDTKASKRMRTDSTGNALPLPGGKPDSLPPPMLDCPSPVLIDCPHPNCNKKYKHMNGLKYHQARAHNDHDVQDVDSEYGDDVLTHSDAPGSCNGAAAISPARSTTPKGRGFDAPSPSPGRMKVRKKEAEMDAELEEEGACLTDEASNDGLDDRKSRKTTGGGKPDKVTQKGVKPGRPSAASPSPSYALQNTSPASSVVQQPIPKSSASSPGPTPTKDKKKKKKREGGREGDSPKGKGGGNREEDSPDSLLNGSEHQNRLASIKAEADKVYSFSDTAPSPSLGRGEGGHLNGAETGSPAYSDISDAGEDGEARTGEVKVKTEPDQAPREGAKKTLFPPQPPGKDYYPNYDSYYSPTYPNASPAAPPLMEGVQVKKEEESEVEPLEDRKQDPQQDPQQPSVIQPRSNMYAQQLYYNQYYVPPYSYPPDQNYHAHLLASNPAYRQQHDNKKASLPPPTLSRAPSLSDLGGSKGGPKPKEPKEPREPREPRELKEPREMKELKELKELKDPRDPRETPQVTAEGKSVIMSKGEEQKVPPPPAAAVQPEGLKMKLSEAGHHGKEEGGKQGGVEPAMWYRQEPDSRLWPYVYPNKYPEAPKPQEEERERERERERKGKEERSRPKEHQKEKEEVKEEVKEGDHRGGGKEARPPPPPQMQFSSPMPQHHQGYLPYMPGPYAYSHGYEGAGHPGFRGLPSVMMQNYPGYLPAGYSFPSYGGKAAGAEEGEKASRSSPTVKPPPAENKALELLQQHASQYKSKSPSVQDNKPQEREREGPRNSPSQRMLPSHHHLGYPLLGGQYDLSYASGLSSSAIVASQQASAPSMYPPPRR